MELSHSYCVYFTGDENKVYLASDLGIETHNILDTYGDKISQRCNVKRIKKRFLFLMVLTMILVMPALQTTWSAAADEATAQSVFEQWEQGGYPDDIVGVYFDQEAGMLSVMVVDPSPERIEELHSLFGNVVIINPTQSSYTYNEALRVYEEIAALVNADSKIYSVGLGSTITDGVSAADSRPIVRVRVDESEFDRYNAEFTALYGDMVDVGIGIMLSQYSQDTSFRLSPPFVLTTILCTGLIGMLLIVLCRRHRRNSNVQTEKEDEL